MKITFSHHPKVHLSLLLALLALLVLAIAGPIASVSAAPESSSATWEASGLLPPLTASVAAEDACRPGTGWRWTTGPAQPETAAQVQQALAQVGIGSRVEATGFGETDSCGRFELAATDLAIALADPGLLEVTAQAKLTATILPILEKFARPHSWQCPVDLQHWPNPCNPRGWRVHSLKWSYTSISLDNRPHEKSLRFGL